MTPDVHTVCPYASAKIQSLSNSLLPKTELYPTFLTATSTAVISVYCWRR